MVCGLVGARRRIQWFAGCRFKWSGLSGTKCSQTEQSVVAGIVSWFSLWHNDGLSTAWISPVFCRGTV